MAKPWPLLIPVVLLAGCAPTATESNYRAQEIQIMYPETSEHWLYFNGDPQQIEVAGEMVTLEVRERIDPEAFPDTLSVNGGPIYQQTRPPIPSVASTVRAPYSNDLLVSTKQTLRSVWFHDGAAWWRLSGELGAGKSVTVQPKLDSPRLGDLSRMASGIILDEILARSGGHEVVVYELEAPLAPNVTLNPAPTSSSTLALAVQYSVDTGVSDSEQRSGAYRILDQGSYSGYNEPEPMVILLDSQAELERAWGILKQNKAEMPPLPELDFSQKSALIIFQGLRNTGGYGFQIRSAKISSGNLSISVVMQSPKAGTLVTQALTSPYVLLEVQGKPTDVRVLDQNGKLITQGH